MGRSLTVLLPLLAVTGCEIAGVGPCVHRYEDPLLLVESVGSSLGGALDSVVLSGFAVDGRSVESSMLILEFSERVELRENGRLTCFVSCGFATEEGTYSFIATADSHQPRAVQVEAQYEEFHGGCPSSNAGSTRVSIELEAST